MYRQMKEITLKPWQEKVLKMMDEQNDRQVLWIYDEQGNRGKTLLAKHQHITNNVFYTTNASTKDITFAYNRESKVIIDLSRSVEDRVNCSVIEQLKNGLMFSAKYQSRTKVFNPPAVCVMSNFLPDTKKLSKDRCQIYAFYADGNLWEYFH